MFLYHGSITVVKKPLLNITSRKTDFGIGFYTTTSQHQACSWANIKKIRHGVNTGYINVYEFDEVQFPKLNVMTFAGATDEWLDFVFANRHIEGLNHSYDIIRGPVANDTLYQTLALYEGGILDKNETISRLRTYNLVDQISFHTEKGLESLNFREAILIRGSTDE
jgi:hypothetical protein